MDVTNPLCPVSKDEEGCYLNLRALKNIQYGDKSTITEIKTPLVDVTVPNEVQEDQKKWDTFTKLYFCKSVQDIKKFSDQFIIFYNRVDGKPEKESCWNIRRGPFLKFLLRSS